ncbi:MAG: hypothetical protein IPG50_26215 [Myxococcales bacterium]|nr:hypothetical protein [Myxococcales bacterium]
MRGHHGLALALAVTLLNACRDRATHTTTVREADAGTTPPQPSDATAPRAVDASVKDADVLLSAKSIGNTSVVFKLTFASGAKCAWKPRSKRGKDRFRGEIAAFRLAGALGVRGVPAATFAALPWSQLESALGASPSSLALAQREVTADDAGLVPGARIDWIEGLEVLGLESEPLRGRWRGWLLDDAPLTDADRPLAAQIATMIVFDSLAGNWDRWSGANVGFLPAKSELVLIDNDGAFLPKAPPPMERQRELMRGLRVFPKALVDAIRLLDDASMQRAVGEERPGVPLLSEAAMRGLAERRLTVLEAVDARVKAVGAAKAFAFP